MHDTDPLFEALRKLPARELGEHEAGIVLRRAQRELAEPEGRPAPAWLARLDIVWSRFIAPLVVTATVASYLVWAVSAAQALYR
jgi:hypothetical protein